MNRLFTLKETLPGNIACSRRFPNTEIILLDYNSSDGLESWVKENCLQYIEEGILSFYRIIDPLPRYFSHAHSRNIAFRLATGNIICNVNADYHVGDNILGYVSNELPVNDPLALIADLNGADRDNIGRICLRTADFHTVGGFDESFKGYGYEDIDLSLRLKMSGVHLKYLPNTFFNNYVSHDDIRRFENSYDYHHLQRAFVRKIDPGTSSVLFLYKDGKIEAGTLIKAEDHFPSIQEGGWRKGHWNSIGNHIHIEEVGEETRTFLEDHSHNVPQLVHGEEIYREVIRSEDWNDILLRKSIIGNYQMMKNRRKSGNCRANEEGFGKGIVMKNFCEIIELK
ncbi:hypothetical protein KTO58_15050 [Chitinophaga pendula]|uniref:glycosyltransferase family 2 protein n=1 Tax=Chitinophaga TaxID=79328 RepID=UPI0018DEFF3C|nr:MULTISPECIES: galactosyltransferase-related protein [Chitinophaga]UCJ05015.1 hypothetical protein KTO58_15050 [Chitinophaga pendula]